MSEQPRHYEKILTPRILSPRLIPQINAASAHIRAELHKPPNPFLEAIRSIPASSTIRLYTVEQAARYAEIPAYRYPAVEQFLDANREDLTPSRLRDWYLQTYGDDVDPWCVCQFHGQTPTAQNPAATIWVTGYADDGNGWSNWSNAWVDTGDEHAGLLENLSFALAKRGNEVVWKDPDGGALHLLQILEIVARDRIVCGRPGTPDVIEAPWSELTLMR